MSWFYHNEPFLLCLFFHCYLLYYKYDPPLNFTYRINSLLWQLYLNAPFSPRIMNLINYSEYLVGTDYFVYDSKDPGAHTYHNCNYNLDPSANPSPDQVHGFVCVLSAAQFGSQDFLQDFPILIYTIICCLPGHLPPWTISSMRAVTVTSPLYPPQCSGLPYNKHALH